MITTAVFGATGQTGSEVTRQLAAKGVPTRALVRSLEKANMLRGLDTEIVQADLEQPETLDDALRGIERVYFMTAGEVTRHSPMFYQAAQRAGVNHIVRLSGSFGVEADSPISFDRLHYEAEKALEQSGLAWTHLHPSYFMQNILMQGWSGMLALPFADRPVNLVDIRDVAAVAVTALTESGHQGQDYQITGPEAITFHEVAARLTTVTGQRFTYLPISETDFANGMIQQGFPEALALDLAREYGQVGEGHPGFAAPNDTVQRVTGQPGRRVEDFARDYAEPLVRLATWVPAQS